jgi:cation transport ATPase
VDQHALTGESAPAEKSRDNVFATTVILAGKILIRVERRQGYRIRQNNGD